MPEEQQLQNLVRAHRLARGWSQEELAARAGVFRAGISAIEKGRFVFSHRRAGGPRDGRCGRPSARSARPVRRAPC